MHPSPLLRNLVLLVAGAAFASANTEKVIFLGPEPVSIPLAKPSLPELNLHTLTPEDSSIRTNLSRVFPTADEPAGQPAWLLLDDLAHGQRYELRVCWSAVEPTSFTMDVYELEKVWETPELVQSLAKFATSRILDPSSDEKPFTAKPSSHERRSSVLLLHIQAAADYFTHDAALMQSPPPVLVDLILDPYVANVLPRSLIPTVGYLVVVGTVTWFVAQWIARQLQSIGAATDEPTTAKKTE
jgi:hypothetical protein